MKNRTLRSIPIILHIGWTVAVLCLILLFGAAENVYAVFVEDTVTVGGGGNPTAGILKPSAPGSVDPSQESGSDPGGPSGNESDPAGGPSGNESDPTDNSSINEPDPAESESADASDASDSLSESGQDPTDHPEENEPDPQGSPEEEEQDPPEDGPGITPGGDMAENEPGLPESSTGTAEDLGESTGSREEGSNSGIEAEKPLMPALAVEDPAEDLAFLIPEKNEEGAAIGLTGADEIVAVLRNGDRIDYRYEDGKIRIGKEELVPGKNRITVRVRDEEGQVHDMDPWEFYGDDLYEGGDYATITGKTKTESKTAEEQTEMKKPKSRKGLKIFVFILLLLFVALLGIYLNIMHGQLKEQQTQAEENAGSQETETMIPETTAIPTPVPTQTPEPTPEITETPEPTPLPTETPTPEPLPGEGHIVCIDPGHQRYGNPEQEPIGPGAAETKAKVSSGTHGNASGLDESELNLQVSLKLRAILEERGYTVIMTRETQDVDISNRERAAVATDSGAEILVRIHANGSENPATAGALTYEPTDHNPFLAEDVMRESRRLSEVILEAFLQKTGAQDRGILAGDNMSGINWSTVPVTIVELGYMTNPEEDLKMADEAYQQIMAEGVADGIDAYFGV